MSNSAGNTNRDVRRFLRSLGVRADVRNVELIGREVRRSESENERVERESREVERATGRPSTTDEKGDVHARVKREVKRELKSRRRK